MRTSDWQGLPVECGISEKQIVRLLYTPFDTSSFKKMRISTTGIAIVRHSETGELFEIEPDEINWEVVASEERDMGPDRLWSASISRDELGEIRWEMSEYPEGLLGDPVPYLRGHELVQKFSVGIEHEPDFDDDDFDEDDFDREAAAEDMREWFYANYEDPANSLPYVSAEGGYQWIYGGPDTPQDALGSSFSGDYPEEFIEEVAADIVDESGLWDWSPIPGPDFFDDGEEIAEERSAEEDALALSRLLPLAEELEQDPETGAFEVRAKKVEKPDLLAATLAQLADAIEDVLENQSNGLNENSLEIRKLRRTLERYANDPQRVEMDLTTVHHSLTVQIGTGELPPSEENQALLSALQEGAQGIRATDPEVAENRRLLQEQSLRELSPENLEKIAEAAPVLEAITQGDLREQMRDDVLFLTQEMRVGPPKLPGVTRADAIVTGQDEAVRVFGRSARMLIALRKTPEFVNKIHSSAGFKALNILAVLGGLVSLGLMLF
ncbi:hypothetical protein [Pseudophaeobacter sp. A-200-2]|uniref:hypothetical protein n=1 Tax=Pseudophaeobacter sp. A-200-2 TaxID=3098145 RepID=UPI0034D65064